MTTLHNDMFIQTVIDVKESIHPNEIRNKDDIEDKLLNKLKNRLGDACSSYGYIQKDSIKIINRSLGEIISRHFNGKLTYNIKLQVNMCAPSKGDIVSCRVIAKNKIGILCQNDPLVIILSKEFHMKNEQFKSVNENDIIKIKIVDYKYNYTDDQIQVVGSLL